jgi:NAD+ synthase (glutamine-hydrolysing)
MNLGMVRVKVAYPVVHVGNIEANRQEIVKILRAACEEKANVVLLPELAITGYTCGDLFGQTALLQKASEAVAKIAKEWSSQLIVIGLPLEVNNAVYNCAAVCRGGKVIGIVPKTFLPNYKEFYEKRWFRGAAGNEPKFVNNPAFGRDPVPFGTDLIFVDEDYTDLKVGVEICEDIWSPLPPSSFQAVAGATLLLNLSASNETVAKSDYRRSMIEQQSGRCVAAYAYCSSGPTESTSDLVFGGHCIVAENGSIVVETEKFHEQDGVLFDVDIERLVNERRRTPTFNDSRQFLIREYREIKFWGSELPGQSRTGVTTNHINRKVNPHPFVPSDPTTLKKRCEEIFNIQVAGLMKRINRPGGPKDQGKYSIGISGGLDSTLAALVAYKACKKLGWDTKCIDAITMPGFGTSTHTLTNSDRLMQQLGFSRTLIDIKPLCTEAFAELNYKPFGINIVDRSAFEGRPDDHLWFQSKLRELPPDAKDVGFENVQARIRTFILMSRGFVLGTGDLSELALGWATYNGDHMSMYNVNCSIPKTLVKFLVKYVAENEIDDPELKETLLSIVATKISPELLPLGRQGEIVQGTEDLVGPYELHDFFLFNFVRNNFAPSKIAVLASIAFAGKYDFETIKKWLKVFLERFFAMQFKRDCVPDGPKVGSVSLSPRGDWRMPSDAEVATWLEDLENVSN